MKTISTKRLYLYLVYNALKRTPPKDYPDTNEMVVTVDEILPVLEAASGEFITFRKEADAINSDMLATKITQEEAQTKMIELQKTVRAFELEKGIEVVSAEFSASGFTTLQRQFTEWGKNWFDKLEDFVAFKKDMGKME
jgi:hypothetical protein